MAKRIGIVPYRYAGPLLDRLRSRAHPSFELVESSSGELAIQLRQRLLDGAFLSPIDYAREYQMYRMIPRAGIYSAGESGAVLLAFRENVRAITTLAVDPGFSSEIVLAHIVCVEKFDTRPRIIPTTGSVDEMLHHADAALIAGDAALQLRDRANKLDLVDEWTDISDLPFVHGVWVTREEAFTDSEIRLLSESSPDAPSTDNEDFLSFQYNLTDDAVAGMTEFFRMAYYHGVLKDFPEVRFLKT
jgi:predicted solute-binding protein